MRATGLGSPGLGLVLLAVAAAGALPPACGGEPPEDPVAQQLHAIAALTVEQQRAEAYQQFLQGFVRRGALLFLHRLDGLACYDRLFSLGDPAIFAGAFGNTDGSDHNLVFWSRDPPAAPSHPDGGPYNMPRDIPPRYYPLSGGMNTYWHEVNHALLDQAGLGIAPHPYGASLDNADEAQGWRSTTRLTSQDDHHPFIEGVGQRGNEAYEKLVEFETAVYHADQRESEYLASGQAQVLSYARERQLWGEAHQRFSMFLRDVRRVANMPAGDLLAYRGVTGIFFSPAEQVADFYREGGLKRNQRGEVLPIKPPPWVFYPDLVLMPVQIGIHDTNRRDLELPGAAAEAPFKVKDGIYQQTFIVAVQPRGSLARGPGAIGPRAAGGTVDRGQLRIQLQEDDDLATLSVCRESNGAPVPGSAGPGGPSLRLFDVDLKLPGVQPLRVTFSRRKVVELTKKTIFHIGMSFADPVAPAAYNTSSASLAISLTAGVGNLAKADGKAASTPKTVPTKASPLTNAKSSAKGAATGLTLDYGPTPAGLQAYHGSSQVARGAERPAPNQGQSQLPEGPVMYFSKGDWPTAGLMVELFCRKEASPPANLDAYVRRCAEQNKADPQWFSNFKHGQVELGGRRGYYSLVRRPGDQKSGGKKLYHLFMEVDHERAYWVSILSDLETNAKQVAAFPQLERDLDALLKTFRFGPDEAGLSVTVSAPQPVPRPLCGEPIQENELVPRPPPPPVAPPDPDYKPRVRPVKYTPPGGAYTLTLPVGWKAGARAGDAQLFVSPDRKYVLTCPDKQLELKTSFAAARQKLAEAWHQKDPKAPRATFFDVGPAAGLKFRTVEEGRLLWRVYVGAGSRAVLFTVTTAPSITGDFPMELNPLLWAIQGLTP